MRAFSMKKVYHDSFWLGGINGRKEITISGKNGGIGNLMFCSQQNQIDAHLNIHTFLLKDWFSIGTAATKRKLS